MITMIGGFKGEQLAPLYSCHYNNTEPRSRTWRHLRMRRSHCPRRHLHHLILIHRSLLHLYSFRTAGTGAGLAGRPQGVRSIVEDKGNKPTTITSYVVVINNPC